MFPVAGATIFANGTVTVHSHYGPCAWRADHVHNRRVQEWQRICMPCYGVYVAYSEMFMRPVQRPITKMTIKINCSHRTGGAMGFALAVYNAGREYVMRK